MATWAKIVNDVLVYASEDEFRGVPNWDTHEQRCRKAGYLPLVSDPETREGYTASPSEWHTVRQSATRVEPRQKVIDIYEEDPETHEQVKVGERTVMEDTEITVDTSYIQVDAWAYTPIPEPTPAPDPVKLYSKYLLKNACEKRGLWEQVKAMIEGAGKWESFLLIQNIASDNEELQQVMPAIREQFGDELVDEVLAESEDR